MHGILIDLDGVVYQNNQAIEGAAKTITWLQRQGIPHLFVTNTTSKPRSTIVEKLDLMGISVTGQPFKSPPSPPILLLKVIPWQGFKNEYWFN